MPLWIIFISQSWKTGGFGDAASFPSLVIGVCSEAQRPTPLTGARAPRTSSPDEDWRRDGEDAAGPTLAAFPLGLFL